MIWIRNVLLVGFITSLSACSIGAPRHWPEQTGAVLEEGTDTPVEGAIVVARWEGWISQLVDSQSVCYHVETANTDKSGRYRIPEWSKLPGKVHHERISYNVYKAGYRHVRSKGETHYIERDTGGAEERLEYIRYSIVSCGSKRSLNKKLLGFYTALHDEVTTIPVSYEQKKIRIWLQSFIDEIVMGFEKSERLYLERLKALEQESR